MKKVVLITGASRGIGQQLGNSLWRYNKILCSRSMEAQDRYTNILSIPCDVTNKDDIKTMVNKGLEKFGRIDVLINNAGWWQFNDFENITEEEFSKMYEVNVKGILLTTQAVLPTMLKQGSGHIINILSIRAITGGPNRGAYTASKFAAKGLMDSLRLEVPESIKITNVCPGNVSEEDVTYKDLCNTIDYVLSLSDKAVVRDLIIGGHL